MDPIKALGKAGLLGNFLNRFDGGVEVLDDLDDHWTAKNHKKERKIVIEDLQDLAADESVRITILSGDVHLAAIGQFYSNPKLGLAKHKDFRYMPNVISSAIVNTPPPDIMADILNKRNKVHHFDRETDEDMIPIFNHGVDGKPRNNKRLFPHRNWCSIRPYVPGSTPAPSPALTPDDGTPIGTPQRPGGIMRRLSKTHREPSFRGPDAVVDRSRPPLSAGIFRSFSRSRRASEDNIHSQRTAPAAPPLTRSLSLTDRVGNLFRRRPSHFSRHDDGGINGTWGDESEDDYYDDDEQITPPQPIRTQYHQPPPPGQPRVSLRGGASPGGRFSREYMPGDEDYFTAKPQQPPPPPPPSSRPVVVVPSPNNRPPKPNVAFAEADDGGEEAEAEFRPKPFLRTPTNLSQKQMKRAREFEVDLEGGLEVCVNVEVSQGDPAGITVPYRLLVPRLWYEDDVVQQQQGQGGKGNHAVARRDDQGVREGEGAEEGYSDQEESPAEAGGYRNEPAPGKEGRPGTIKRLFSLKRGQSVS